MLESSAFYRIGREHDHDSMEIAEDVMPTSPAVNAFVLARSIFRLVMRIQVTADQDQFQIPCKLIATARKTSATSLTMTKFRHPFSYA